MPQNKPGTHKTDTIPFIDDEDYLYSSIMIPRLMRVDAEEEKCIHTLLQHVMQGEQEEARMMLKAEPDLLLAKGHVTDYSGRSFENITAYQCALWTLDTRYMTQMMRDCIPFGKNGEYIESELFKQATAALGSGNDLVKLANDPTIGKAMIEIGKLLKNEDGILFYNNQLYYANKKEERVGIIEPKLHSQQEAMGLENLKQSFALMSPQSSRQSTALEHHLITVTMGHTLAQKGVRYTYNGAQFRESHYNFSILEALQNYVEHFERATWDEREKLWLQVGEEQKKIPAHIAQHYCESSKPFYPLSSFESSALIRSLEYYSYTLGHSVNWFSGQSLAGLGTNFAIYRGRSMHTTAPSTHSVRANHVHISMLPANLDLLALRKLRQVRLQDSKLPMRRQKPHS